MKVDNVVTLENQEKYLILEKEVIDNNEFFIGIKIINDKYVNEFKIFNETKKENEIFIEEIEDKDLIKVIVDSYLLNKFEN